MGVPHLTWQGQEIIYIIFNINPIVQLNERYTSYQLFYHYFILAFMWFKLTIYLYKCLYNYVLLLSVKAFCHDAVVRGVLLEFKYS